MKKILILGGGTAGTMMANKLRKALDREEWEITIVDKHKTHYYQPGFLFIPFGTYNKQDVIKSKSDFFPAGVKVIFKGIDKIVGDKNQVILEDGKILDYDFLIVATGTQTRPDETPGLKDKLWYKDIFDFYTIEGAVALQRHFKSWEGGTLVMAITELPFKCPVAPIEFVCLAEEFFAKKGMRDKVNIKLVTPLPGAFTKPVATKMLSELLKEKNIEVIPDFYIERVDNERKVLVSYDEKEVPFDTLTIVPLNMGDEMVERSGLGDDLNFIPTDKHTLQSKAFENIFVLGDASNIPTSKAGSVAHFAAEILFDNMMSAIEGRPLLAKFDGHANCYIETGHGKGALIDFNYDTEPLPGTFPLPGIGPFGLLKNTRINHYGKIMFRWIYWHILLRGKEMPIEADMTMAGKKKSEPVKPKTMEDQSIQTQINELNHKMDLILDNVNQQRLKAEAVEDLVKDLSIVGKEIYDSSVEELENQQVSIDPDALKIIVVKLIKNIENIGNVVSLFESANDLAKDAGPIVNEMIIEATKKLHTFEQKGYFEFFAAFGDVIDNIVTNFSKDDVVQLADNIATILQTVKNLTQPEMLGAVNNAVKVYQSMEIDNAPEYSIWKLMRELNKPEMKKALGFAVTFLKNIANQTKT